MALDATSGKVTLPIQQGLDRELPGIIKLFGADAVRNSDGTWLPQGVSKLGLDVYSTYFPARGDQQWAQANLEACPNVFLMTPRIPALDDSPLRIRVIDGYLTDQVQPNTQCDTAKYWQVIDRTTGDEVAADAWRLEGADLDATVVIDAPVVGHVYTVAFLAWQRWDSTQMYNYITNGWEDDPERVKEIPYDVRNPQAWQRAQQRFSQWLQDHPEVTWVRFTTFFYHFTLVFNDRAKEQFVDWFGYTASVSPAALDAFAAETGFDPRPEDFVAGGRHSTSFSPPTALLRAWIDFQHRFVTQRVRALTDIAHRAGRKTIMFLGDTWIGTEPYGPRFGDTGLDGVVGSVGSAATTRMITDIPGVQVREGRMLPYFFPDVFNPDGDPLGELEESWLYVRRAILRKPLQRIGFGGYLSLALQHPDFMARAGQVCQEFRDITALVEKHQPSLAPVRLAILNSWGSLRTWQTHMVAHALHYDFTAPYVGVLEALAGLPFDVKFMDFQQAKDGGLADVDVVINVGAAGEAFSGGDAWRDPQLQVALRRFVADGGGLIGVGDPSAAAGPDAVFQLADVLGVDRQNGLTLSTNHFAGSGQGHFIAEDGLPQPAELNPQAGFVYSTDRATKVLVGDAENVALSTHEYGRGRAVYASGLCYGPLTARILHRACYWAASREDRWGEIGIATDPRVEITEICPASTLIVCNTVRQSVTTTVVHRGASHQLDLEPAGIRFLDISQMG